MIEMFLEIENLIFLERRNFSIKNRILKFEYLIAMTVVSRQPFFSSSVILCTNMTSEAHLTEQYML